jgi:hypothetical protein
MGGIASAVENDNDRSTDSSKQFYEKMDKERH